MHVLETRKLTKYYGSFLALDKVDLSLGQGEVLGFIGPNGAGKTTSIRILLGLLRRSAGEANLFGKDAWSDAVDIHRRLAYVPGDVQLWPNLTGGEVIDLFCKLRGGINKTRREAMVRRFDLDTTKKCSTYSKGNRQKVALVAAFASDAELFILDEPTSGLDPLMASVFQECVAEKKREGNTVLMSSHILADVEKLCDRVSIIRKGKIVETGTLSDLRHLTRTAISVETNRPIDNLERIGGIHGLNINGTRIDFHVDTTQLDTVMQYLVQYGIRSLTSTPPSLEELFMRHYSDDLASLNNVEERSA